MSWLFTIAVIAAYGALAVFALRLVRFPYNRALQAVVVCLLLHVLGTHLQQMAYAASADTEISHGLAKLTQNIVLYAKYLALTLFFLLSAGGREARRRARWEFALFLTAAVVLTATMYATPIPLRDHAFATAPMHVTPVAAFYFAGGMYFVYITAAAARWAWRYGTEADWRLRAGLCTAAAGLALQSAASLLRAIFTAIRWYGVTVPPAINGIAIGMLVVAGSLFIVGLVIGVSLTQLAKLRIWLRHRHWWRALRPLWELLYPIYPDSALDRHTHGPPSRRVETWHVIRMHRRYWRRYVECRDGLVQLSPHLAAAGYRPDALPAEQAAALRQAVQYHLTSLEPYLSASGYRTDDSLEERASAMRSALRHREIVEQEPERHSAVQIAPVSGSDGDLRQLLTLSRALTETRADPDTVKT